MNPTKIQETAPAESLDLIRPEAGGPRDFRQMEEAFEAAGRQAPAEVRHYRLGGRIAALRCAGRALAEAIDAPLAHLRCQPPHDDGEVALRVDLWDQSATGVAAEECVVGPDPEATGRTFVYGRGQFVVHQSPHSRTITDRAQGLIVGWFAGVDRLTQYELGRPLHSDLLLWHRDRGIQAVHAGLVALDGEGVLFGGAGGAGKTTTALTCLRAGMAYLADDYVGLERTVDGTWLGHSLYASTHLAPHHILRFPDLLAHSRPGRLAREDKHLVLLERLYPGRFAPNARVRAVALPNVVDAEVTTVRPASKAEVLRRLAPSSLFQLPYGTSGRKSFDTMVSLIESVPTFWLDLGRRLESIPVAVAGLLGREVPR